MLIVLCKDDLIAGLKDIEEAGIEHIRWPIANIADVVVFVDAERNRIKVLKNRHAIDIDDILPVSNMVLPIRGRNAIRLDEAFVVSDSWLDLPVVELPDD